MTNKKLKDMTREELLALIKEFKRLSKLYYPPILALAIPRNDMAIEPWTRWALETRAKHERKYSSERLSLLVAVAEAAVGYVRERNCLISMPLATYLSKYSNMMDNGERALVEVLIALEAHDE